MFKEHGSEAAVKAAGGYRQQGKNYIVEDGDIIFFKVKLNLRCFVINVLMPCLPVQCWRWSDQRKGREKEVKQKPVLIKIVTTTLINQQHAHKNANSQQHRLDQTVVKMMNFPALCWKYLSQCLPVQSRVISGF